MNLKATRLSGRPRNRWQDEVREDGRLVAGKVQMERVYNREEWKKLQGTARNLRILHMPMERINKTRIKFCTCQWNGLIKHASNSAYFKGMN